MNKLSYAQLKTAAKVVGVVALGVYINDCIHVYRVYNEEQKFVESVQATEEETKKLVDYYTPVVEGAKQNGPEVDQKAFRAELEKIKKMQEEEIRNPSYSLEDKFKIGKESIIFAGGPRAAFLQNSHPYVASGITQHSNLKESIHQRFLNTFKNVFAINFGDWEKVFEASTGVRKLHAKVIGELPEDIGFFKKGHRYSAGNFHALYWVNQTLVEGAILMYEMFVNRLTEEEKQIYYKSSFFLAGGFGIPAESFPATFKEFKREAAVFMNSDMLTVGTDSLEIGEFILTPPQMGKKKPSNLMVLFSENAKWITFMTLPKKLSVQYFGRAPNKWDEIKFAMFGGYIRFIYRLLPGGIRYLNPYLDMLERYDQKLGFLDRAFKNASGWVSNHVIAAVLPSKENLTA